MVPAFFSQVLNADEQAVQRQPQVGIGYAEGEDPGQDGLEVAGLLFQISATDPSTFAAVTVLLILVALTASYIPARRAAGIEPTAALNHL